MNFYGQTDKGIAREMNQDVYYTCKISEKVGFAIVCDGMGGQNAGHIASEMVCSIVSKRLQSEDLRSQTKDLLRAIIVNAISEANVQVFTRSNVEAGLKGMGTTIVMAVVVDDNVCVAHIGDSRVYALKGGKLRQVTRDHSLVQELIEQGKINSEEARIHPNKNMITRAVGVNLTVDIDYLSFKLESDAKLILCSDGLTNMVGNDEIEAVVAAYSGEEACAKLIELANAAGGMDNVTVAMIEQED